MERNTKREVQKFKTTNKILPPKIKRTNSTKTNPKVPKKAAVSKYDFPESSYVPRLAKVDFVNKIRDLNKDGLQDLFTKIKEIKPDSFKEKDDG